MELIRGAVLVTATIAVGAMAGTFFVYAVATMPGLNRVDDRTFVGAFQAIDRAIINPVFLAAFFGALALPALASVLHVGADVRSVLPWTLAATACYLIVVIITVRINVPLNDAIKAAGDPARIDVATVREQFNEALWARWNVVRTVLNLAALGCLTWATVIYGRLTG